MRPTRESGTVICQRCLAANSLDEEFCARCGTRLMLVVEPTGARYEEDTAVGDYEEHLLERVSALENHLMRVIEKVEQGIDLLARQARASYYDHLLLETLLGALDDARVLNRRRVQNSWRERIETDAAEVEQANRRTELKARIRAGAHVGSREAFTQLVNEGFALIEGGKKAEGIRTLERAAALATDNAPLNSFIGEHFFRARKWTLAREYLSRAFTAEPGNRRVCLLLGLVCGDEGDADRAKSLLKKSLSGGQLSFAAHYALGRLHAAESDWRAALAEFKHALAARKCPEVYYVIGLVYYQTGRYRLALRHLQSALRMDEDYGEAHYLLGLVQLRLGERRRAAEAFAAADIARGTGKRVAVVSRRKTLRVEDLPQPQFLNQTARKGKRLLTGGDNRLAAALREDALGDSVPR